MKKYQINDPWDWVTHFEDEIAKYTGYRYGIAHVIQIPTQLDCVYTT